MGDGQVAADMRATRLAIRHMKLARRHAGLGKRRRWADRAWRSSGAC